MIVFKLKKQPKWINHIGKLSKHFSYSEMTKSDYALRNNIDNTPNLEQIENLHNLCTKILDKIRIHYNVPVFVTSGFRCPKVNKGVGGYKKSQHLEGEGADFIIQGYSVSKVWKWIAFESGLDFDCCILEFNTWIHISYKWKGVNRNKILIAKKENGKTKYYEQKGVI